MSKKKIVLQFPNLQILWNFAQTLRSSSLEINTNNKTLTCACSDTDIALAIEKFRATVVRELQESNN